MPQTSVIVPDKGIRACRNSTGADIAAGILVSLVPTGTEDPYQIRLPGANGAKVIGATMNPIKNGDIGDVQVEGRTRVLFAAGGLAVGGDVTASAAGQAMVAGAGNIICGICVRSAVPGDLGEIELSSPVGARIAP
jgi:hypothetical protein